MFDNVEVIGDAGKFIADRKLMLESSLLVERRGRSMWEWDYEWMGAEEGGSTASVRTGCGTLMDKGPRIFTATTTETGFSFRQGSRHSAQGRRWRAHPLPRTLLVSWQRGQRTGT